MKVTAGLLWGYAKDSGFVSQDITENLYTGKGHSIQREPLTEKEIETIRNAIGSYRYADYIYCLCYLGFRPGEFLSLRKDHYRIIDGVEVLINGSKTEAGRNRVVVIPPQILDLVRARMYVPGTDLIFPQYCFSRKPDHLFLPFKQMTDAYFREDVFKQIMKSLGIAEGKVPYSARHSYSDKLKRAEGDEKAKAELMGHTDYAFTQSHYQSTDMNDLLEIAVSIE
jgi:integrase